MSHQQLIMTIIFRRSYAKEWFWKEDGNNDTCDTTIELCERDSGDNQSMCSCNRCLERNVSQVKPFDIKIIFFIIREYTLNTGTVVEKNSQKVISNFWIQYYNVVILFNIG